MIVYGEFIQHEHLESVAFYGGKQQQPVSGAWRRVPFSVTIIIRPTGF